MRIWAFGLAIISLWAQKSKVTSAALAVQDAEYEKALNFLQEALASPQLLKPKDIAKAYMLRGRAYMGMLLSSKDPQGVLNKYPNLFEEVILSIRKCKEQDAAKEFENDLKLTAAQASGVLYLKGFELFQKEKLADARQHFTWALELYEMIGQKEFYPPYALRGIVNLQLRDTTAAIQDLEKARTLAAQKPLPKEQEGQLLPFVYSSLINAYGGKGDTEKALSIANEGRSKFPTDDNIRRAELNLYLQNPGLQEKALERFRQELQRDPKNETYMVIYAQLWERINPDSAAAYYQQVLALNPNNLNARYNLGAYYVNQAAELSAKYNETRDEKLQQKYFAKMQEYFRLALPHLEKAHEQLPEDMALLQSLIQVTTHLGMDDKAQDYLRKKNTIQQKKN
ncbi:MAG: hypothetical protein NZZ60_07650 [Bacteroidia bacterium]|nr:hypothetical protein [Bacteroidia bacterium]MCX7652664.1 hypothetical protein [Bacteroidia bacterium]MDW8416982.1 hypothetical protein [Bacteroidia bacterium]